MRLSHLIDDTFSLNDESFCLNAEPICLNDEVREPHA